MPTDIARIDLEAEKVDRQQLIDLLKHMLLLDQDRRIKPDEALNHPFQTLTHLAEYAQCTTLVFIMDFACCDIKNGVQYTGWITVSYLQPYLVIRVIKSAVQRKNSPLAI